MSLDAAGVRGEKSMESGGIMALGSGSTLAFGRPRAQRSVRGASLMCVTARYLNQRDRGRRDRGARKWTCGAPSAATLRKAICSPRRCQRWTSSRCFCNQRRLGSVACQASWFCLPMRRLALRGLRQPASGEHVCACAHPRPCGRARTAARPGSTAPAYSTSRTAAPPSGKLGADPGTASWRR